MKKALIAALSIALFFSAKASAQQNLFISQDIESAIVAEDGSVTFNLIAPKARKVQIAGDFAGVKAEADHVAGLVGAGMIDMTQDKDGMWTYTTAPLPPELYSYTFIVDGVSVIDPNNPHAYRDFATLSNVFIVGGGRADLFKVNKVNHGTLHSCWYPSSMGYDRRMNVYTPYGYESSKQKYPVLYLLHGMGGDEDEWVRFGRTCQILDNLIAQGKAKPMIVVMTNGHTAMEAAPGESSLGYYKPHYFESGTMDGEFESIFMEIVNYVDKNYRTIAKKDSRAIAGLSMGGFHSAHISANNPDAFGYVGLFSAALGVTDPSISPIYQDMENKVVNQFAKGVKLYWTGIGNEDFLYNSNKEFRAMLDSHNLKYTYLETSGGHVWTNWRIYLSEFVPLLFK